MANIKQQMKRDITNDKKRLLNASFNSSLKTAVKAFHTAVLAGDKVKAQEAYNFACKENAFSTPLNRSKGVLPILSSIVFISYMV